MLRFYDTSFRFMRNTNKIKKNNLLYFSIEVQIFIQRNTKMMNLSGSIYMRIWAHFFKIKEYANKIQVKPSVLHKEQRK